MVPECATATPRASTSRMAARIVWKARLGKNASFTSALLVATAPSRRRSRVRIAWRTEGGKVRFMWIETNGPPVNSEIKAGFGSKLISRVVAYDLAGTADLDFAREGFRCTLTFPLPRVAAEASRPLAAAEP